jgi:hypothetical protein
VASFGVEYSFKKIPPVLSFDYRLAFVRYGRSTPSYVDLIKSSNIGLGLNIVLHRYKNSTGGHSLMLQPPFLCAKV